MPQLFERVVGLLEALGADERVWLSRGRQRRRVGAGENPVLRRVDKCALFLRIFRGRGAETGAGGHEGGVAVRVRGGG